MDSCVGLSSIVRQGCTVERKHKADKANLESLSQSNIWAVVGSKDNIVNPQSSIDFINALNESGNISRITVIEGYTHFDVPEVYKDKSFGLTEWLVNYSTTGIRNLDMEKVADCEDWFDLQGNKVTHPRHGLFINKKRVVAVP